MVRTDYPPTVWPNRFAVRRILVGGVHWALLDLGDGPVLLLLHGTGAASHSWADVAPALAALGYRVIAPDLPGHGGTDIADPPGDATCSLRGMASATAALLHALGVTPVGVVGHSAGVAVALQLLADGALPPTTPVLGFNAALVPPPAAWDAVSAPLVAPLVESRFVADLGAWAAGRLGIGRAMLGTTGSRVPPHIADAYAWCLAQPAHVHAALTMMARWTLPELLETLRVTRALHPLPLTLVHGADDRWVPLDGIRRVLAKLPGAELRVQPRHGHVLHEEDPALAVQEIRRAMPPVRGPA